MKNRGARHFGFIAFVIYFSLLILFPVTHYHAADALAENTACGTGHGPEHLLFFLGDHCCELHESDFTDSDEHHIHFLIDDQGIAAARYHPNDSSLSPQILAAVDVISLTHCLGEGFVSVLFSPDFCQEAFLSYSSGLSPPIS